MRTSAMRTSGMRISVRLAVVAIVLLASVHANAHATIFSQGGWGWWTDQCDPAALGRGGASVAVAEYGSSGAVNPASIAGAEPTYGFAAYQGELMKVKGDEGEFTQRQDLLPQLGGVIQVPKLHHPLQIGILFRSITDASFERVRDIDADTSAYRLVTKGSGGWNRVQLVLAGRGLGDRLSWGVSIGRTVGTVRIESGYAFVSGTQGRLRNMVEGRLAGAWTGGAGAIYRPDRHVALGASYALSGSSRLIQESRVIEGGNYNQSWTGRQELPSEWGIGIQARPFTRTAVSADYRKVLWGSAGLRQTPGAAFSHPFDDVSRWGIGIEQAGSGARPRTTLRAGYMQTQSYLDATDGTRVVEKALTLGGRLVGGKGRSAIDVALELGKRGDESKLDVSERFARLTFGISYSSSIREY
jgi:hypothetical protein